MSDELERIEKKIDDWGKTFVKISNQITEHRVQIENCEEDKNGLKDTLYGNGKDGLVLQVDRIETRLKTTGIIRRSMWTNIIGIFVCVGVAASIIIGAMSYNHSKSDDMKLAKRIVEIEKFLK